MTTIEVHGPGILGAFFAVTQVVTANHKLVVDLVRAFNKTARAC